MSFPDYLYHSLGNPLLIEDFDSQVDEGVLAMGVQGPPSCSQTICSDVPMIGLGSNDPEENFQNLGRADSP